MATTTTNVSITTSWKLILAGTGSIQIQGGGETVLVRPGTSVPTDDVGAFGFRAGQLVQNSDAAENLYARATGDGLGTMNAAVWTVA